MRFKLIKDLKIENFYFNSGLYLNKNDLETSTRENLKLLETMQKENIEPIIQNNNKYFEIEALLSLNLNKNKNIMRNRINKVFNEIDYEDTEDLNNKNETNKLLDDKVITDDLIILIKSPFSSNQQFDIKTTSIIYFELNEINFGFPISKEVVDFLILTNKLDEKEDDLNG